MEKIPEGVFKATLVTIGRKSGQSHSVLLRAVSHQNKIYFSRRNPNSDWLKNSKENPTVQVVIQNFNFVGQSQLITDKKRCAEISRLKYSDERANEPRIVLEVFNLKRK